MAIVPPRRSRSRRDAEKIVEKYRAATAVDDPFVSPLHALDLGGLPPAVIITADCDPLRDDGFRYAQRLREAGVPVRFENYMGMPHGFLSLASLCPAAPLCIELLVEELRSEEHTSELQSLMRISYAVFCLKKKKHSTSITHARHLNV